MAPILSQIVVVLTNRELSDGSGNSVVNRTLHYQQFSAKKLPLTKEISICSFENKKLPRNRQRMASILSQDCCGFDE